MGTGINFYPQRLCSRVDNCSTRPEPNPLPSLKATPAHGRSPHRHARLAGNTASAHVAARAARQASDRCWMLDYCHRESTRTRAPAGHVTSSIIMDLNSWATSKVRERAINDMPRCSHCATAKQQARLSLNAAK
jgi:hypothetical protein